MDWNAANSGIALVLVSAVVFGVLSMIILRLSHRRPGPGPGGDAATVRRIEHRHAEDAIRASRS